MRSLDTVGSNKRADDIAKKLGFKSAEALKGEYIVDVAEWDMKYDVRTKEIVLENHNTRETEATGLYMPDGI